MWAFLRKNNYLTNSVELPVVNVYGTLKIRASVADVNSVATGAVQPKPKEAVESKIIVYGSDDCGWCTKIKRNFDSCGIEYSFVSCDDDAGNR
jgi:hypothetical protein